jgi:hypothetical protein
MEGRLVGEGFDLAQSIKRQGALASEVSNLQKKARVAWEHSKHILTSLERTSLAWTQSWQAITSSRITKETRFWSASEMKEAARQQGGFFL